MPLWLQHAGWVALGGAAGSVLRYLLLAWLGPAQPGSWPWATFAANLLGCLLLGWLLGRADLPRPALLLLATGFCGGLTTFSTFVSEQAVGVQAGHVVHTLAYALLSMLMGFGALVCGQWLARA